MASKGKDWDMLLSVEQNDKRFRVNINISTVEDYHWAEKALVNVARDSKLFRHLLADVVTQVIDPDCDENDAANIAENSKSIVS